MSASSKRSSHVTHLPSPAFTSPWCPIDLPCETHASVLLSPPHPPPSPVIPLPPRPPPHPFHCPPPPHTENDQPSLVWFDRGKFYLTFEGKFALHGGNSVHERLHSSEAHLCKLGPSLCPVPPPHFVKISPSFHCADLYLSLCPSCALKYLV